MASSDTPFEIHVHGDIPLRPDVSYAQLEEALKPIWSYAGAKTLTEGAISVYEEEPGIRVDDKSHVLQMCWTVTADDDFRSNLEEMCMNLNELSATGAAIEISIYDTAFDELDDEDASEDIESRDDFLMLFVGPTPGDIMQAQRDMLIEDISSVMERHFERSELSGVIGEIDKLFSNRFNAMIDSLTIPRSIRGSGAGGAGAGLGGHGGGRKPRHLH